MAEGCSSFSIYCKHVLLSYPNYTEVQLGLLSTLQYQLEAGLALIGHPVLIVAFQDPLLFRREHRPKVHLRDKHKKGDSSDKSEKKLVSSIFSLILKISMMLH